MSSIPPAFELANRPKLDFHPPNPSGFIWCYTRYSDEDLQRESSIEQQVRACREDAVKNGHVIPDDCVFADAGVRGWKTDRPALNHLQELIRTGRAKPTDVYFFDTARAYRNTEQALKLQKFFDFHKICVHYVANGMVSGNSGFKIQHTIHALIDEQYSETLGHNVRRGQVDQFEKGYLALVRVYGYTHVDDLDPAYADSFDRRHRKGVNVVINPAQAEVVRLIFHMYRKGKGYEAIARHLNRLAIKSPRRPTKNRERLWGTSSIRTIVSNDRYTGFVRYGVVESRRDPETGSVKHITRPESEWRSCHEETLRIIDDEEFEAVQKIRSGRDTLGAGRKAAGLNKANGIYPWSGLLKCSDCGGAMSICQPNTYICSTSYKGGTCRNRLKLNRGDFQEQMLNLLVRLVREARSFDTMLDALMGEIQRQFEESERIAAAHAANRGGAQAKLTDVNREISNLVIALGRNPDSIAIEGRLRELETERKLLLQQLEVPDSTPAKPTDREEVAEYLSNALENLYAILSGDPHTCRDEIRKRVDHLVLKPTTFENHPAFEISGDLRLFHNENAKMLGSNGHLTAKHFCPVLSLTGLMVKVETNGTILRIANPAREGNAWTGGLLLAT